MPVLTKINTNVIADDAVTAAKIPAGAVAADIGANGIGLSELDNTATGISGDYHKVPVFADDAARNTAIGSPAIGMLIYNTAAGAVQQYNGVWSTIAPAPNITSVSGFLNNDTDSTITVFGTNFNSSSAVKMFTAASGGSQIGSDATTTFNSSSKLTAVDFESMLRSNELKKNLFSYVVGGIKSPIFLSNKTFKEQTKKITVAYINLENVYKKKKIFLKTRFQNTLIKIKTF